MNWLNLNIKTLDSEEFIGSDPVSRATWICLLRYCIGQENGGRIDDCNGWADRKWQQLVRVTKEEVDAASALWSWDGQDLVVWEYPAGKELEVQGKRKGGKSGGAATSDAKTQAARENGKKGGRPKTQAETQAANEEEPNRQPNGKELERKGTEVDGEKSQKFLLDGEAKLPAQKSKAKGTLLELKEFAVEIGLPESDGEHCFYKWEGNGWKNDGKPVMNWKATIRSWKTAGYLPSLKPTTPNGYTPRNRELAAAQVGI